MLKLAVLAFVVGFAYSAYYEDGAAERIAEQNARPNSFKAGFNEYFAGMSDEDIDALMGVPLDGKSSTKDAKRTQHPDMFLPTSFHVGKDKWSACAPTVNYIKDQAKCGSCWAVAASSIIADRICIQNIASMSEVGEEFLNEGKPQIDMSAEQIMSCCQYCGQGCSGGYPIDAMKYWHFTGVVTGGWYHSNCGCMPYQIVPCGPQGCDGPDDATPRCNEQCRSGYSNSFNQDKHTATDYMEVPGESQMMAEIYKHGSIECQFTVYANFMDYKSGVYDHLSGGVRGGHAIRIVGWGHDSNQNEDYWIINNSWNTTWGMSGVVHYLRGRDLAGMESGCVAGMAKSGDSNFKLTC